MGAISKPAEETVYDASKGVVFEKTKQSKYMTDREISELPFLERVNWLAFWVIFGPLFFFLIGLPFIPLTFNTAMLTFVQYVLCGLSITAGYHRLWSHKAYRANFLVEIFLALWGAAAFEGSARWWCRGHRAHHRYVDTEKDPYTVHKGFWHAHIGWMVLKQDQRKAGRVDISDLNAIWILQIQHKYYLTIAISIGYILPMMIAHFGWGDLWGGLIYAGFFRAVVVQQATFCINSLAHTLGEQSFSTQHSSFDSVATALITFGEGYHNFHHEFPHDYRNGIKWFHYDPTKWLIRAWSAMGAAWDLQRIPDNEIDKAKLQVRHEALEKKMAALESERSKIDWGPAVETLPVMTWQEVEKQHAEGKRLVVIDKTVLDVGEFMDKHPGGRGVLSFWAGRDATLAFQGEVYKHSKAAQNLLPHLRVARLVEELESPTSTAEGFGLASAEKAS